MPILSHHTNDLAYEKRYLEMWTCLRSSDLPQINKAPVRLPENRTTSPPAASPCACPPAKALYILCTFNQSVSGSRFTNLFGDSLAWVLLNDPSTCQSTRNLRGGERESNCCRCGGCSQWDGPAPTGEEDLLTVRLSALLLSVQQPHRTAPQSTSHRKQAQWELSEEDFSENDKRWIEIELFRLYGVVSKLEWFVL